MEVIESSEDRRKRQLAPGTDERELHLAEDIEELKAQMDRANQYAVAQRKKRNIIIATTIVATAGIALSGVNVPKFLKKAGLVLAIGSFLKGTFSYSKVKEVPNINDFSDTEYHEYKGNMNDEKSYIAWLKNLTRKVTFGLMLKFGFINEAKYKEYIKKFNLK